MKKDIEDAAALVVIVQLLLLQQLKLFLDG